MIAMMLDMKGDSKELSKAYHTANDKLQEMQKKSGLFEGLVFHTAGPTATGFRIVDVWRSREQFEKFAQAMMPIAMTSGMSSDVRPEIWEIENSMNIPAG